MAKKSDIPASRYYLDQTEEIQIAYQLLGILQKYAPNSDAQVLCTKFYRDMVADGFSAADMVKAQAGAIMDGLENGNWPWIVYPDGGVIEVPADQGEAVGDALIADAERHMPDHT